MARRERSPAKKTIDKKNGNKPPKLPPGVKLLRTLKGYQGVITSVAFDAQGVTLASGSDEHTLKLWVDN